MNYEMFKKMELKEQLKYVAENIYDDACLLDMCTKENQIIHIAGSIKLLNIILSKITDA